MAPKKLRARRLPMTKARYEQLGRMMPGIKSREYSWSDPNAVTVELWTELTRLRERLDGMRERRKPGPKPGRKASRGRR